MWDREQIGNTHNRDNQGRREMKGEVALMVIGTKDPVAGFARSGRATKRNTTAKNPLSVALTTLPRLKRARADDAESRLGLYAKRRRFNVAKLPKEDITAARTQDVVVIHIPPR